MLRRSLHSRERLVVDVKDKNDVSLLRKEKKRRPAEVADDDDAATVCTCTAVAVTTCTYGCGYG